MSNLSELLPTGGGQNAVDFVASGTLSSGQTVALKADGTVEAVAETVIPNGTGAEVVFTSSNTVYISATYDSVNNKVVISYGDLGNSNYGTAVVGTVSGSSISFGSPVVFQSSSTLTPSSVYDLASGKVVIAYPNNGNSGYGTAIVGTVSGASISFGSAVVFESANTSYISATYDPTNSKVIVAYTDRGNSDYGTARVGTVSGNSISFGTVTVFESALTYYSSATYDSTNSKVVIAYKDFGNAQRGTAIVGTVSGTSISFGAAAVFESGTTDYISAVYDANSQKIVIAYMDSSNSQYGTAIVGEVVGTGMNFPSAAVVFNTAISTYIQATYDASTQKVVVTYQDNSFSNYGAAKVGTVSGTTISFGARVLFGGSSLSFIATTYDSTSNKVIIAYQRASQGRVEVWTTGYTATNYTSFIGITAEAIANTATGPVNVYGGINEAQTGLTIGSDYYVQNDGSLSTTASSVKVGQAISATTINMMDLT